MEKHILTYTSDGTDKTAVAITKIRNSGTDIIGEIVYTGTDEGTPIVYIQGYFDNYTND